MCIQPQQAPARFHGMCKILRKNMFFLTSPFFLENGTPSGTIKILRKSVYFLPAGLGFRSLSKPQIASQAPGGPQAASRGAQGAPRRPQEVPRRSPGGIGRLPGGPREPQEATRRLPGEPSEPPGRSQEAYVICQILCKSVVFLTLALFLPKGTLLETIKKRRKSVYSGQQALALEVF